MLRKFKISIDGKEYLVEMEEIGGGPQAIVPTPAQAAPVAAAPQAETAAVSTAPVASSTAGADTMTAPMPGKILKILVNVGDKVVENQPLMILEAMKMENEVVAATAGTATGIHVAASETVNAGDAMITIS